MKKSKLFAAKLKAKIFRKLIGDEKPEIISEIVAAQKNQKLFQIKDQYKKSDLILAGRQRMIKVYRTSRGIKVREGVNCVDINKGVLASYGTLHPESYVEESNNELVYTYYGPLEVGQVYPHDAIKPELGMVVLNTRTHLVYQYKFMGTYEKAYPNAWVVAGLIAAFEHLDEGNYQILKLGDA